MSINCAQLCEYVIRPTLMKLGFYSPQAEKLMICTAAVESRLGYYLAQVDGPALGIYQIEPNTHDDIYANYLDFRPQFKDKVLSSSGLSEKPPHTALATNLAYSTAICRVKYLRAPKIIPDDADVAKLGDYWKSFYNTKKGAGDVKKFIDAYHLYVSHMYGPT